MAALMTTHVKMSRDNAEPQFEDNSDQNESGGGSSDKGSDDELSTGVNDKDGDGGGSHSKDEDGGKDEEEEDGHASAGWAEAMAKILGKKIPETETRILVKNKELDKLKEKERLEQLERKKQADKKRAWEMMCREKPDIVRDREAERALQKTATRGVVQLFNAVRKHQKTIDDKVKEVAYSERKKAKVLSSVSKKEFIDVLRRTEEDSGVPSKTEDAAIAAMEKPTWSVLRDDFMMGATMKDWDKESDGEDPDIHRAEKMEESD